MHSFLEALAPISHCGHYMYAFPELSSLSREYILVKPKTFRPPLWGFLIKTRSEQAKFVWKIIMVPKCPNAQQTWSFPYRVGMCRKHCFVPGYLYGRTCTSGHDNCTVLPDFLELTLPEEACECSCIANWWSLISEKTTASQICKSRELIFKWKHTDLYYNHHNPSNKKEGFYSVHYMYSLLTSLVSLVLIQLLKYLHDVFFPIYFQSPLCKLQIIFLFFSSKSFVIDHSCCLWMCMCERISEIYGRISVMKPVLFKLKKNKTIPLLMVL